MDFSGKIAGAESRHHAYHPIRGATEYTGGQKLLRDRISIAEGNLEQWSLEDFEDSNTTRELWQARLEAARLDYQQAP